MTKLDDTWRGSIQSFFAHHAETRPERLLAVSNHGSYNYGEVHALSNRLANYLLKVGGIQKEERVAIYAHRSCPLVVAMMGILKSGATITIIDPAYPPARQIIYFEVAEPRALVMIKAAGPLPAETKAYVERTKTIRTVLEGLDMEMLQVCDSVEDMTNTGHTQTVISFDPVCVAGHRSPFIRVSPTVEIVSNGCRC